MNTSVSRRSYMKDEYEGFSKTPTYRSWYNMLRRNHFGKELRLVKIGFNTADLDNVPVCLSWVNDFGRFLDDMGSRPTPFHTLNLRPGATEWNRENVTWEFRPPTTEARKNLFVRTLIECVVWALVIATDKSTDSVFCDAEMIDELHDAHCSCNQ